MVHISVGLLSICWNYNWLRSILLLNNELRLIICISCPKGNNYMYGLGGPYYFYIGVQTLFTLDYRLLQVIVSIVKDCFHIRFQTIFKLDILPYASII